MPVPHYITLLNTVEKLPGEACHQCGEVSVVAFEEERMEADTGYRDRRAYCAPCARVMLRALAEGMRES